MALSRFSVFHAFGFVFDESHNATMVKQKPGFGLTACPLCSHCLKVYSFTLSCPRPNCTYSRLRASLIGPGFGGRGVCGRCIRYNTVNPLNPIGLCDLCTNVVPSSYTKLKKLKYHRSNRPPCQPPSEGYCSCNDICDSSCLNRIEMIECSGHDDMHNSNYDICKVGASCSNRSLAQRKYSDCRVILEPGKGWGLMSMNFIKKDELVQEYLGEVIDSNERLSRDNQSYIVALGDGWFVDAALMGNESRFTNHSCDPNCEFVRKHVDGYLRLGIYSIKDIPAGNFLSLDYQCDTDFTCKCGSPKCKGRRNPNLRITV